MSAPPTAAEPTVPAAEAQPAGTAPTHQGRRPHRRTPTKPAKKHSLATLPRWAQDEIATLTTSNGYLLRQLHYMAEVATMEAQAAGVYPRERPTGRGRMRMRPGWRWFIAECERKLDTPKNSAKPGWQGASVINLLNHLGEEYREAMQAFYGGDDDEVIISELTDVANYAMFTAGKVARRGKLRQPIGGSYGQ